MARSSKTRVVVAHDYEEVAARIASTSGQEAEDLDVLPPERWPTSVSEVVSDCLGKMSDRNKERLRRTKKEDLIMLNFEWGEWGMGIRNYYGLRRGNKQLILSACGKPCHPEDASLVIIKAIWAAVRKKDG